jgi:hypothetical protein
LANEIIKSADGKDIALSARFPHVAAKGSWLDDAENADDRMGYGALEPSESDLWIFVVCVPEDVTMIEVRSELHDEQSDESIVTKKIAAAP